MNIFVASGSIHKISAVRDGTAEMFPGTALDVRGIKVPSDINEQPVGHEETIQGALNRLENMREVIGETRADLLVAIENGIFSVELFGKPTWFDLGWVVVEDADGNHCLAHSTGIRVYEDDVDEAERRGFATTTVGSIYAARTGADATDPNVHSTNVHVSRAEMLKQAFKTAFGQLLHIHAVEK